MLGKGKDKPGFPSLLTSCSYGDHSDAQLVHFLPWSSTWGFLSLKFQGVQHRPAFGPGASHPVCAPLGVAGWVPARLWLHQGHRCACTDLSTPPFTTPSFGEACRDMKDIIITLCFSVKKGEFQLCTTQSHPLHSIVLHLQNGQQTSPITFKRMPLGTGQSERLFLMCRL